MTALNCDLMAFKNNFIRPIMALLGNTHKLIPEGFTAFHPLTSTKNCLLCGDGNVSFAKNNGNEREACFCYMILRAASIRINRPIKSPEILAGQWQTVIEKQIPTPKNAREIQMYDYSFNFSGRVNDRSGTTDTYGGVRLVHEIKKAGFMTKQELENLTSDKKRAGEGAVTDDTGKGAFLPRNEIIKWAYTDCRYDCKKFTFSGPTRREWRTRE
jgi:hypothetical protein